MVMPTIKQRGSMHSYEDIHNEYGNMVINLCELNDFRIVPVACIQAVVISAVMSCTYLMADKNAM